MYSRYKRLELPDFLHEKFLMEERIAVAVAKELTAFHKSTGQSVKTIWIDLLNVSEVGHQAPEYIVGKVETMVSLNSVSCGKTITI
jgi:hypothetical protein